MHVINIPTMKTMVSHIAMRMNQPMMFWGPPGCGKTEGAAQAAQEMGALLCDIRVSQYEGVDFRGIPSVEGGRTLWNLPPCPSSATTPSRTTSRSC
jgi:midasin (ATPase involved in ribosome maturation)